MSIQLNNHTWCLYPGQPHPSHFTQVGLPRQFYLDNLTQVKQGKTWVKLDKVN